MPVTLPPAAAVEIIVQNVRNERGRIRVNLCRQEQFLKDCPWEGDAPARAGAVTIQIANVPPGRYAAQAFHDENNDRKVDRGLFGIPREGVGFSNDAKIRMGPPKFSEAAFDHSGVRQQIRFSLRYF